MRVLGRRSAASRVESGHAFDREVVEREVSYAIKNGVRRQADLSIDVVNDVPGRASS